MKGLPLLVFVLLVALGVVYFVSIQDDDSPEGGEIVTSFTSCVNAGNLIMDSYPRQCSHNGVLYTEDADKQNSNGATPKITCKKPQRDVFCTQQYEPVCGFTKVECVTTPCDPVPITYGNACTACSNKRVVSYTEGVCNFF